MKNKICQQKHQESGFSSSHSCQVGVCMTFTSDTCLVGFYKTENHQGMREMSMVPRAQSNNEKKGCEIVEVALIWAFHRDCGPPSWRSRQS